MGRGNRVETGNYTEIEMPAASFSQIDALADALATDRFEILLDPQAIQGANSVLALRCQQIVVPEEMIEPMLLQIHGMEFSYRGRRTYDKAIGASFVEFTDAAAGQSLRTWMQNIVGGESHNGQSKRQYAVQGTLNIFDQSGDVALAYRLDNCWPQQIPQIQLDGTNAAQFVMQTTFTFDRLSQNGVTIM